MAKRVKLAKQAGGYEKVSNNAKFVESLRRKGEHVLKAAREGLRRGVVVITNEAIARCPVRTGKLQSSIDYKPARDGNSYVISASATNPENGVNYAQMVEFDPRINKPFLYPALRSNLVNLRRLIKTSMEAATRGNV